MKKFIFGIGTLLVLGAALPAQAIFQSYYQWSNTLNADHGPYNKVKTWMDGANPVYFAVGGAINPANNVHLGTLSCIDGITGSMIFTQTITPPFHATADFEAVSVAISTFPPSPTIAVLCTHTNTSGVKQAILYQFDVAGNLLASLNLGAGTGVDVAYNPTGPGAFDVLCEVNGTVGTDFELTGVDLFGFVVLWENTYNWDEKDKPTSLAIDNGKIVAGGYTEIGGDRQILIIRTDFVGTLHWGQPFGLANRDETVSDVVFYRNLDGQLRYGFCGWDELTGQTLIGDVNINGPQFGYTERYITAVNGIAYKTLHANAIARSDSSIFICGETNKNAPFIASFTKNANLTPQNFNFHDDGEDVPESLLDITCELGASALVKSVGYEQRSVAWGTSPANQNYSWILATTTLDVSTCGVPATEATVLYTSEEHAQLVTVGPASSIGPFTGFTDGTHYESLDNCITPARLAAPGEGTIAAATTRFSNLYPNPGNGTFYLDGVVAENENALLSITDLQGRNVATQQLIAGISQQKIELNNLANGIYYWSVLLNGETLRSDKLIIAR